MPLVTLLRPYVAVLQIAAYLFLVLRLFRSGLYRTYKMFTLYVLYELARLSAVGFLDPTTKLYANFYFFSQPITWLFLLLVILELYELSLKNHAGIATWGRRVLASALFLSAIASVATVAVDIQQHASVHHRLALYATIERVILLSLLLFLFALTWFLSHFPVPVNRNTIVHLRVFAIYFLMRGAVMLTVLVLGVEHRGIINLVQQISVTACLCAWAFLLTPAGETVVRASSYRADAETEERLLSQLNAINQTLLGSAKR